MTTKKLEKPTIALLVDLRSANAQTITDHIYGFSQNSAFKVRVIVCHLGSLPRKFKPEKYDAIIVHYTIVLCMSSYIDKEFKDILKNYRGIKGAFIQDEYRHVNDTIKSLAEMSFDILFTCVPEHEIERVYSKKELPKLKCVNLLTGYVPESLKKNRFFDYKSRPIELSYRSRQVPWWLGSLGQEKIEIGPKCNELGKQYNLKSNISNREEDRIYGRDWVKFLRQSKAVLGVESGASVFDFDGTIAKNVDNYRGENPDASFKEVQGKFFLHLEDKIDLKQISPRFFESAASGCVNVLFEGEYSNLIEPWRHFVPLKKDYSNFEEVIAFLRSPEKAIEMVERTYDEVIYDQKNSYQNMAEIIDTHLAKLFGYPCELLLTKNHKTLNQNYQIKKSLALHEKTILQNKIQNKIQNKFTKLKYVFANKVPSFKYKLYIFKTKSQHLKYMFRRKLAIKTKSLINSLFTSEEQRKKIKAWFKKIIIKSRL